MHLILSMPKDENQRQHRWSLHSEHKADETSLSILPSGLLTILPPYICINIDLEFLQNANSFVLVDQSITSRPFLN